MHAGQFVSSEFLGLVPRWSFRECVGRHRGNRRVRHFSWLDQFLAMALARLTFRKSLSRGAHAKPARGRVAVRGGGHHACDAAAAVGLTVRTGVMQVSNGGPRVWISGAFPTPPGPETPAWSVSVVPFTTPVAVV